MPAFILRLCVLPGAAAVRPLDKLPDLHDGLGGAVPRAGGAGHAARLRARGRGLRAHAGGAGRRAQLAAAGGCGQGDRVRAVYREHLIMPTQHTAW